MEKRESVVLCDNYKTCKGSNITGTFFSDESKKGDICSMHFEEMTAIDFFLFITIRCESLPAVL